MRLMISEVLQKAHNAKTKAQKVKILQDNNTQTLRSLFIINFDETIATVSLWVRMSLIVPTKHLKGQSTLC